LTKRHMLRTPAGYFSSLFTLGIALAGAAELPYGGWLQIPILSAVWLLLSRPLKSSTPFQFIAGIFFGLGYFVLGLWWIYVSLHDVGGMNVPLAVLAVFLLSAYVAIYFSIASLVIHFLRHTRFFGLILASSWVLLEYLRGTILTGFPWIGFAETQITGPFAPVAPLLGGLGCTFLVIWASWELSQLKNTPIYSAGSIIVVVAIAQLGVLWSFTKPIGEPISVRLIQGNFEQSLKFNPQAIQEQFTFYTNTIEAQAADLIVTPETAYPWPQSELPDGILQSLRDFSSATASNILIGVIGEVQKPDRTQYANRALGISPNAAEYQYDKSHLVPFGEFTPPGFQWFVRALKVPLGDFSRGALNQPFFAIEQKNSNPINAAITICYEDIFGGELASRLRDSKEPANLLVNMTNLAWFGKSQAPSQQLRQSQLRSLEVGLPSIRATNTGITAILGPDGKVIGALPQFSRASLGSKVQAYSGKTPYVVWGNAPILTLSCLLLIFGLIRQRRSSF
jgi:apolipoprotein N-acyltransferase